MTLHIFNPEHDIALAANLENFTSPHAGRLLRHDLGFLPALWAGEGDVVLTDDAEAAAASLRRLAVQARKYLRLHIAAPATFVSSRIVGNASERSRDSLSDADGVEPWGWDLALRAQLRRRGVNDGVLPTDAQLADIRSLSHRRTAARLMQLLLDDAVEGITGEVPAECTTTDEVETALRRHARAVVKAPWSSSGRGIRFVGSHGSYGTYESYELSGVFPWLRGVLSRQGSVMVEPYYNKVKDLGMEFEALPDGSVRYCGLSLFHTANGQYTGNILATEQTKREKISRYIPLAVLDSVRERICHHLPAILYGRYQGPLGVDMMIVHSDDAQQTMNYELCTMNSALCTMTYLHPCVEINLRRTMGHAALSLTPADDDLVGVMRIEYRNDKSKADLTLSPLPALLRSTDVLVHP